MEMLVNGLVALANLASTIFGSLHIHLATSLISACDVDSDLCNGTMAYEAGCDIVTMIECCEMQL